MTALGQRLYQTGTPLHLWVSSAIFVLFLTLVLPGQKAASDARGGGERPPDLRLFYTPAQIAAVAEEYGPEGRQAYVRARFTFDLAWPLAYTYFYLAVIGVGFRRTLAPDRPWHRRWVAVAVAPFVLDMLENTGLAAVMLRHPAPLDAVVWLSALVTALKWLAVGAAGVAMAVSLLRLASPQLRAAAAE